MRTNKEFMNIRLNKVIRELNVGIDTIVDFLREKGFEVNATPNEKISGEQYDLLKKKFGADRELRTEADKLLQGTKVKSSKEKKPAAPKPQAIKTEIPKEMRPGLKTVGKIDLDTPAPKPQTMETNKPAAVAEAQTATAEPKKNNTEPKPEQAQRQEKKQEQHKPAKQPTVAAVAEEKPKPVATAAEGQNRATAKGHAKENRCNRQGRG